MNHKQILDLIFGVQTLEEIRLAKAVQTKYLREHTKEEMGWWQVLEVGEILIKSERSLMEQKQSSESDSTPEEMQQALQQIEYSTLGKRARKSIRIDVNRWYCYRELCQEARKYLGWE